MQEIILHMHLLHYHTLGLFLMYRMILLLDMFLY